MRFFVYRTGSNAANQPMTFEPVHVATVEASSEDEAVKLARKRGTCYHNQYLHAENADEIDAREAAIDSRVTVI
jgi:hypothetical protein